MKRAKGVYFLMLMSAFTLGAQAESDHYPIKPVRLIYPFSAGGGGDLVARTLSAELSKDLKQSFIVDNRAGGNGNIGTDIVSRATPDGYTVLLTTNATIVINPQLFTKSVTYDPVKGFSPVSLVVSQPFVLVLHPSVAAKTVPELMALAKANPGALNYASSGAGGGAHLAGEMLKTFAHIDITHVPFKGSAPALTALMSGEVQFMFVAILAAKPLIEQNRLRAIAVSTAKRNPVFSQLPAVSEFAGLENFESDLWYGFLAPAKTPTPVIHTLYQSIRAALDRASIKNRFESTGTVLVGSSPLEFSQTIAKDLARWGKVIKTSKVSADY